MPPKRQSWIDSVKIRLAVAGASRRRHAIGSKFRFRRAMALVLGAAFSVGGVSEAFEGVRVLVRRDLDSLEIVRQRGTEESVVARVRGGFAANSIYKIAKAVPDRLVSQQASLVDSGWLERSFGEARGLNTPLDIVSDMTAEAFFRTLPFGVLIHQKATKYDVDPALVAAVVEAESRFRQKARSPVGAQGLMQLMPRTGKWMGARNLYDPEQNIDAGVKYLKYLEKRFDGDLNKTIAAYNAGEGTVRRYGKIPPYRETRTYVKRVLENYEKRTRELEQFGQIPAVEDGSLAAR